MGKKPEKKNLSSDWRNWALSEKRSRGTRWRPSSLRYFPKPVYPEGRGEGEEAPVVPRHELRGIQDLFVEFRLAMPEETQTPKAGEGQVTDLSPTGMKVWTTDLRRGDYLRVIRGVREFQARLRHRFLDPPLELEGRIVSVDYQAAPSGQTAPCALGIWFGEVADAPARRLEEFIERVKESGGEDTSSDRRFHKRLPFAVEALVAFQSSVEGGTPRGLRAVTVETSVSGLRLKTYQLTERDLSTLMRRPPTVDVQLQLPDSADPLHLPAKIVWGKRVEATPGEIAHVLLGLQYTNAIPEAANRLIEAIRFLEGQAVRIDGVDLRGEAAGPEGDPSGAGRAKSKGSKERKAESTASRKRRGKGTGR